MKQKVAEYVSEFCVRNGMTDCFMVTGGGAMHLDDAIGHQKGLRCIFNHHEQGCAIAAEAYARMTGRLPLVSVTSGPGGTNAMTGVLGGWLDSVPMFVVSGQVKRETTIHCCPEVGLRQLGDQEYNITASVSGMTKYAAIVWEKEDIAYHLEKALYLATHGRKGPVWLDIPLDIQGASVETEQLHHFSPSEIPPEDPAPVLPETAEAILDRIRNAEAPLILAGAGIRLGGGSEEFLRLVQKLGIPVVTAWNSSDLLAYDSPYYAGMPGTIGTRPGNFAIQNCDLLVSLGCRLNIRMIGYTHFDFAKNAYKIIVDIDPKELQKPTIKPDFPICADVKDLIRAMLELPYEKQEKHVPWLAWCRDLVSRYPAVLPSYHHEDGSPVNPYVFIDKLFPQLNQDERILCGNGSACVITFQGCRIRQGQRLFTNSGCATMGYGLPAAIGAAVADPSRRVICIDGDGSIMMNLQELATAAYNHLDLRLFLLNNHGYHSMRQTQRNLMHPPFVGIDPESGVGFPDFSKVADAFGFEYQRISSEPECDEGIRKFLSGKGPGICEVILDPSQDFMPKTSSRVLPDGSIVSPSIDDMAPFLDREEFSAIRYIRKEK